MDPVRGLVLASLLAGCGAPASDTVEPLPPPSGGVAPSERDGDTSSAWSVGARAAVMAADYAVSANEDGYDAVNPAQGMRVGFGVGRVSVAGSAGASEVGFGLRAWGRADGLLAADAVGAEEGPCLAGGVVDPFGVCLRRVDYARPGLVEWWENRPEGLEQGFTVTAPPDGEGPLVFDLTITGATVHVAPDGVRLDRPAGEGLHVSGLAAWDSRGEPLPAWMEPVEGGVRYLVDDADAVGTITVDPLVTTAAWTGQSDTSYAYFGAALASAGDVNGDGFGDVIVGAPQYSTPDISAGRAYVFLGSAGGLSTTAAWTAQSDRAYSWFAFAVAAAGDVNADGYGDVVVGAYYYANGETEEGRAYLYLGSSAGLDTTAAWIVESDQVGAHLGGSVAGAGDVNGDGYADVIVGAAQYDGGATDEGRALLYLGSASGLSTTAAWTGEADQAGARYGVVVAGAGDVNADGYGDLLVGADRYDGEGHAFLYLGAASGPSTTPAWEGDPNQGGAGFGCSLAAAGDVNGDGYADVIVGAETYDAGSPDEGRAFVYLGSATGLATTAAWTGESDQSYAIYGHAVGGAGDVNGDGYADVAAGAMYYSDGESYEGKGYLYLGGPSGPASTATWTVTSDQYGGLLGSPITSVGDVNGDGFGDLGVGLQSYDDPEPDEGLARVYLGSPSGLATGSAWTGESDQAAGYYGFAVGTAGDVNGDGYGDVIVSASNYQAGETYEGRAYLYLGSATGLAPTAAWTVDGEQVDAHLGYAAGSAGDVNGDGYGDIVLGSLYYENGQTDEGRVWVFHGSPSGLAATADWIGEADQDDAHFGMAAAGAGDVNGDGYGDLIVGAPGFDAGESNEGRAFVYLGSASGLGATPAWTAESDQASAFFGGSVQGAGDTDGDGYDDVVVGAYNYDAGETNEGRVFLYRGSAAGLEATAAWTAEPNQTNTYFGYPVAAAGDVNGDGYADVIVGGQGYDDGSSDEGAAWVYLGSASGLGTTASWTAQGNLNTAYYGNAVGSAGDVNGDGYGDIVVGAYTYSNGSSFEGRAFVYLGSAAGPASTAGWTAESNQAGGYFGSAVGSAGDVNGDGYGDLLVGAKTYDNGTTDEGRAFLYLGNGADGTTPLARAVQARQPGSTTPLTPGGVSTSETAFDVGVALARGPWGAIPVRLQVEVKPLGTPFDGTGLVASNAYTASGTGGVALQQALTDLTGDTGYHWRARVQADPTHNPALGWGPWAYGGVSGAAHGGHVFTAPPPDPDLDGDGWAGSVDCDDGDPAVNPGAVEACNGWDDDCDAVVDEAGAVGEATWFLDADADGYGDAAWPLAACEPPADHVLDDTDCDDTEPGVNPGAVEVCNGLDDDCDALVDDATATDAVVWYADADADGYGDAASWQKACEPPADHVLDATDCLDTDASSHPGGVEACDGVDDDCNGVVDDAGAPGQPAWYTDADTDGYGAGAATLACSAPPGTVAVADDCDDGAAAVNPGAAEACNDLDDDCDGLVDEAGALGEGTWYVDADLDGYGDPATALAACDPVVDRVIDGTDCDDAAAAVFPGAPERCDGVQNDCDLVGWTSADEDGEVWHESDSGLWTSYTASWAAGSDGSPTSVSLPGSGTLWVCDGTWYVRLSAAAPGAVAVEGRYGGAVLSAGGVGSVLAVTGSGSSVALGQLTLRDGVGSGGPTRGGAIRVTAGTVTVDTCVLEENSATSGGALAVLGGTVSVTNSTLSGNSATQGGGWYQSAGSFTLEDSVVELNSATDGGGGYFQGGSFYTTGASLLDNVASSTGGGLRANRNLTITSGTVVGNSAANGAGVYFSANAGTLTLAETLVDANTASGYGAGVYQAAGTLTCSGSSAGTWGFTANVAGTGGGGVYLPTRTSGLTATGCDFGATPEENNFPTDILYQTTTYNRGADSNVRCRTGRCTGL